MVRLGSSVLLELLGKACLRTTRRIVSRLLPDPPLPVGPLADLASYYFYSPRADVSFPTILRLLIIKSNSRSPNSFHSGACCASGSGPTLPSS